MVKPPAVDRAAAIPAVDRAANPPPASAARSWGLPDDAFEQRRPLRGQITKQEVRAVSLYALALPPDGIVWDIGAGTGSVSVAAAALAHRGMVYAIERDDAGLSLLERNIAAYSPGNVQVIPGSAPEVLAGLSDPDAVFIGGSGGRLAAILDTSAQRLNPGGRIVVNLAALERTNETRRQCRTLGFAVAVTMVNAARGREMADGALRFEGMNPVFVVTAWRAANPEDQE